MSERSPTFVGPVILPPLRLPGQHFAAATVFLVLGAAALVWKAPALAAGAFSDPGLIAAVHLVPLGWISTWLMGALYSFLPAALGAPVRWPRLADFAFWTWTTGVAAFVAGLAADVPGLHVWGAAALGPAILLFGVNVFAALFRAVRRDFSRWCVAGAVLSLGGAWVLGALLAVNLRSGVLGASRFTVLVVHLHVAAGGWVLLAMIAVSRRLLPMLLRSHGASEVPGKLAAALVAFATAALLLSEHLLPVDRVLEPALALLAAGATAFLVQAGLHYRQRDRHRLNPGARLAAAALGLVGLAVVAGLAALLRGGFAPRLLTVYGILLLPGGLALLAAGLHYAILPSRAASRGSEPVLSEREARPGDAPFYDRLAHGAVAAFVAGAVAMTLGAAIGSAATCAAGGSAYLVGAGIQSLQTLRVFRSPPG